MAYTDMIASFEQWPRDVHTVPTTNKTPIWFYVYVESGIIYVETARNHIPKSNLKHRIKIKTDEYEEMLELYHKRGHGTAVSKEATTISRCQSYWYGIFSEMGF